MGQSGAGAEAPSLEATSDVDASNSNSERIRLSGISNAKDDNAG